MDHHDKRYVRCLHCVWLISLPAALEADVARDLAEGLARLHLRNAHAGGATAYDFELVNLGGERRLRLPAGERGEAARRPTPSPRG